MASGNLKAQKSPRLDVDASFVDSRNIYGLGGAIRNHEGQLVAAFGRKITASSSVSIGELLAVRDGLDVIRDKNLNQVHISSDSLLTVQTITKPFSDFNYVGLSAKEIKDVFDELAIVDFAHVRRSVNVVAYSISMFALFSPTLFCWMSENFSS